MPMTPEEFLEKYLDPTGGDFPPLRGKVIESMFATDARFQNGDQMLAIWKMQPEDGSEVREQFWGVGKVSSGWVSLDGGRTVVNRDGKKLHPATAFMRGVLVPCAGWGLGPEIEAAGGSFDSQTWVGTSWEITQGQHDFGGNLGVQNVKTLTAYLGGFGDSPAPAAPVEASDKFNGVLAGLTQTERAFLEEQAKAGGNLSDWAIVNMPGKMSDPEFLAAINDPAFKDALLAVV